MNNNHKSDRRDFLKKSLICASVVSIPSVAGLTFGREEKVVNTMQNSEDLAPSRLTPQPQTMESFGQNQGIILYKTKLIGAKSGKLRIYEPHDMALVFLNGEFIDTVFRSGGKWEVELPKSNVKDPILEIVVEGMGHINFAEFMIDRKGITDHVSLDGMTLMNWETHFCLWMSLLLKN